jgi:hypothetical protein
MEENDTVEHLKLKILQELDRAPETVKLTHRLKVLSNSRTLKEEKLESGEVVDVMLQLKPEFGGASTEIESEDVPNYSQ